MNFLFLQNAFAEDLQQWNEQQRKQHEDFLIKGQVDDYPADDKLNIIYSNRRVESGGSAHEADIVEGNEANTILYPKRQSGARTERPKIEPLEIIRRPEMKVVKGQKVERDGIFFDYVIYLPPNLKDLKGFIFDIYGGGLYRNYYNEKDRFRWLAHKGIGIVEINLSDLEQPFLEGSRLKNQHSYSIDQLIQLSEDIAFFREKFPKILRNGLERLGADEETMQNIMLENNQDIARWEDDGGKIGRVIFNEVGLPVFLYGASFGGFNTLMFATNPDINKLFEGYIALAPSGFKKESGPSQMDFRKAELQYINRSTLIIQGKYDVRVPPGHLEETLREFLQDPNSKNKNLVHLVTPEGGHSACGAWLGFEADEGESPLTLDPWEETMKGKVTSSHHRCEKYMVEVIIDFITKTQTHELQKNIMNMRLESINTANRMYNKAPSNPMEDLMLRGFIREYFNKPNASERDNFLKQLEENWPVINQKMFNIFIEKFIIDPNDLNLAAIPIFIESVESKTPDIQELKNLFETCANSPDTVCEAPLKEKAKEVAQAYLSQHTTIQPLGDIEWGKIKDIMPFPIFYGGLWLRKNPVNWKKAFQLEVKPDRPKTSLKIVFPHFRNLMDVLFQQRNSKLDVWRKAAKLSVRKEGLKSLDPESRDNDIKERQKFAPLGNSHYLMQLEQILHLSEEEQGKFEKTFLNDFSQFNEGLKGSIAFDMVSIEDTSPYNEAVKISYWLSFKSDPIKADPFFNTVGRLKEKIETFAVTRKWAMYSLLNDEEKLNAFFKEAKDEELDPINVFYGTEVDRLDLFFQRISELEEAKTDLLNTDLLEDLWQKTENVFQKGSKKRQLDQYLEGFSTGTDRNKHVLEDYKAFVQKK